MEELFRVRSKDNQEDYKNFLKFHLSKVRKVRMLYNGCSLLFLIIAVIYAVLGNYFSMAFTIIAAGFMPILYMMFLRKIISEHKKSLPAETDSQSVFLIFDDYIEGDGADKFPLDKLIRAYETGNYFYLYTDAASAVILRKSGFEKGSADEFREFISVKLKDKFKSLL